MDTFSPATSKVLGVLVNSTDGIKAVKAVLRAAGIQPNDVVVGFGGKFNGQWTAAFGNELANREIQTTICIESKYLGREADFSVSQRYEPGYGLVIDCKAVPDPIAWVFADNLGLASFVKDKELSSVLTRLPMPEQIPFPDILVSKFDEEIIDIFELSSHCDIAVAASRSPTLRVFLEALFNELGRPMPEIKDAYSRNLNRDIIANLMAEVSQPDMPVYRAADGATYTAEQMIRHIREGSSIGQQYASDLLRVSRDMLARQAKRAG